ELRHCPSRAPQPLREGEARAVERDRAARVEYERRPGGGARPGLPDPGLRDAHLGEADAGGHPQAPTRGALVDAVAVHARRAGRAMAAFGYMHKMCNEPLLTELTHYVMRDESRHVAFGVLSLNDYFQGLTAPERREREEFLYEGCRLMRDRLLMEDVWEVMGWPVDEVREIVLHSPQMQEFRKMLFSKVVPNVKRLGLLTPYLRERFAELGILQFE